MGRTEKALSQEKGVIRLSVPTARLNPNPLRRFGACEKKKKARCSRLGGGDGESRWKKRPPPSNCSVQDYAFSGKQFPVGHNTDPAFGYSWFVQKALTGWRSLNSIRCHGHQRSSYR